MNKVAAQAVEARHHPEWSNIYKNVFIRWTTHNPAGLSHTDLQMAGFCDRVASKNSQSELENERVADQLNALTTEAGKASEESKGVQAQEESESSTQNDGEPEKEAQRLKEKAKVEQEESSPDDAQGSLSGIGGQPT